MNTVQDRYTNNVITNPGSKTLQRDRQMVALGSD